MVNLEVKIKDFTLNNPILAASGTYGYSNEYEDYCNVEKLGAIVTKAITLNPRKGNIGERLFETKSGLINRIGLENMGIDKFLKIKSEIKVKYIVNIAGSNVEEYIKLARICQENRIEAIELNASCPNVKEGCLEFGIDEKSLFELVSKVRQEYTGCLIVKLTPNVTSCERIAISAQKAGADAISAINTVKALGIKINYDKNKFSKLEVEGGLSGPCIKPIALSFIKRISKVIDIPIIGIGGISNIDDVFEFLSLGVLAVQIGTCNFTYPNLCEKLVDQLKEFMIQNGFKDIKELREALKNA